MNIPWLNQLRPSLFLGYPEPGKTILYDDSELIELAAIPLAGGTLLKTLVLSIDPYMRNLMNVSALYGSTTQFFLD